MFLWRVSFYVAPVLYPLKERSGSSHKRVSASKQKSTRTIQRKQVTPRHSNSATPGSSRHSTPATDEFTSPRNPTLSSHRDNVARSAANPGICMSDIPELDLCCVFRYTHYAER